MYKLFIFCIFLYSFPVAVTAQKEWINWNSPKGGITFKSGAGKPYSDVPQNLAWPDYTGSKSCSYSDPVTGDMLFLTDGKYIWNKDYKYALEGGIDSLISSQSDNYKVQIVPFNNNPSKFYLFHEYSARDFLKDSLSLLPYSDEERLSYLYYSIFQIDFAKGSGKLIQKNIPILKHPLDRITLIRHANNRDTWVIAHPQDSSYYSAFLVTDSLVHAPVISTIGPAAPIPFQNIRSQIAASPNGKMIAASGSSSTVGVYNFNNSTGVLSNYRTIRLGHEIVTSLCFSPGNSKLYIATTDSKGCESYSKLYQVDLNENDLNKSLFPVKQYIKRSLELTKAKDNRIWIKNVAYKDIAGTYFEVIEYPDLPKNACVVTEKYLKYGSSVSLPNIINNYIQQSTASSLINLNLPDTIYSCSGQTSIDAEAGYEKYTWSTGDSTRSIKVRGPGLYTVLAGKKESAEPQAYGYVYVKSTAANAFNAEDTIFCPKTLQVLKVPSNITNILWMDGDTSRIKPVQNQQYKLTGIDNNGCIVRDSICVNIHNDPVVSFGRDTTFCSAAQLQLTLKSYIDSVSPGNVKTSSFLWQDGSTNNSFTVKQEGTYWGSIEYNGCTVADTINVKYISIPDANLGNDTSLCDGNPISFSVEPSDAQYRWSTGNVSNSITVEKTGSYWVRVSKDICVNTDTVKVVFKTNPVVSLQKDTVICEGTSLTLSTVRNALYQYKWQNGDTSNSIVVTTEGIYSVTASVNQCIASDTVAIGVIRKPVILLSDTILCKGEQMILKPGVAATDNVVWGNAITTHDYRITTPGVYSVEASNKCGSDNKNITVKSKLCELKLPTAFTPNHDNLNDFFKVKYPGLVKEFHLMVYNRLGQKIFETTNSHQGWDGTLNGIPQPMGTYVWSANYTDADDNREFSKGYVVLLR